MIPYGKPHLTVPDQIALLRGRGMNVADEPAAKAALAGIGYYRLSGYWHSMRAFHGAGPQRADTFLPGANFDDVVALYAFDRELRLLVLDAVERVEVGLRVDIAFHLGARDPFLHRNPLGLDPRFAQTRHARWLIKLDEAARYATDDFAKHHRARYSSPLPIWKAIELWDFGQLSHFVAGMRRADRDAMARRFRLPRSTLLTSWVRTLNNVRNNLRPPRAPVEQGHSRRARGDAGRRTAGIRPPCDRSHRSGPPVRRGGRAALVHAGGQSDIELARSLSRPLEDVSADAAAHTGGGRLRAGVGGAGAVAVRRPARACATGRSGA